ncbi:MAG TPA: glycine--tRNA ligase subunit beta [Thermoanaerobaculia bacterium]|nr:glycine--tRNA ligase subunit beta [Thermoanaerobaculia bacterium]HUM29006.1 glycine--tRNA ligase subunit beta [Thermoanaerobaculia bacterium]HXK67438.1 glycine--tRNA ligase subunit beta [Thermoanaerobaculia bacterium]
MTTQTLVLELLLEEMPAGVVTPASKNLSDSIARQLSEFSIHYERIRAISTSRRLGVMIEGLSDRQEDREELVTGPPWDQAFGEDGTPTRAAEGFARSRHIDVSELEKVETDRGLYAGIRCRSTGKMTSALLPDILTRALSGLRFPREMRWGAGVGPFVRPVHGILALLDREVIPLQFMNKESTRSTVSHRQKSSLPLSIESASDYPSVLQGADVLVFHEDRMKSFLDQVRNHASSAGAQPPEGDPLLEEWASMVEYPGQVRGSLKEDLFTLPVEILEQTLRHHQKAILLRNPEGKAIPVFLAVMDRREDHEGVVRQGQEWVIQARLEDAGFFFHEDRKLPMVDRVEGLKALSFHDRVGNYLQKTGRIQELSEFLAHQVGQGDLVPLILQAARLCKADLATQMVGEFPELQGIIGGIYTRDEGVDERVWKAIYQHYMPRFPEDALPDGPVGAIVALADRMDTLASLFAAGEIPTGSRDPFGLRRIGNGLIQILMKFAYDIDLDLVFARSLQLLETSISVSDEVHRELRSFMEERQAYLMGQKGFSEDEIRSVLEVRASHPVDALARLTSIHEFRDQQDFLKFILAFKRLRNILGDRVPSDIDAGRLVEDEEKNLYAAFIQAKESYLKYLNERNYTGALRVMESLSNPLDVFFDKVMVMTEDKSLQTNRLALLGHLYREFLKIAQFSNLQVEKAQYRST